MGGKPRRSKQQVSLWHEGFAVCVMERAPSGVEITGEHVLSIRPRRVDLLIIRRTGVPNDDHEGRILRGLWPRLAKHTLVEFKSPGRELRAADLIRLASYGRQYHAELYAEINSPEEITLALVTPGANGALTGVLAHLGWHLRDLGDGYGQIVGAEYDIFVAFTDQVAEAEQDDFLRIFSHHPVQTTEARYWLRDFITMKDTGHDQQDREGYDDLLDKFVQSLPAKKRLAGLLPEERLAGLLPEEMLLALPDELLRALSDEYVRGLPRPLQRAVRKRLKR